MLNEEEIEKALNNLWSSLTDVMFNVIYSQEQMQEDLKTILSEYKRKEQQIQILETREQKLIVKLELEVETDEEDLKYNNLSEYGRGCLDEAKEILEILKGEKIE